MRRLTLLSLGLLLGIIAPLVRAADAALWIDVRTPEEFAAGHLPGAINIPHQNIALEIGRIETHKTRPINLARTLGSEHGASECTGRC